MKLTKAVKNYMVDKYTQEENSELGNLPYEDVKNIIKGYKYDEMMDMYFSKKGNVGYYICEA